MFVCLECGKKYRSVKAARNALNDGCSKCGGCDIDIDVNPGPPRKRKKSVKREERKVS